MVRKGKGEDQSVGVALIEKVKHKSELHKLNTAEVYSIVCNPKLHTDVISELIIHGQLLSSPDGLKF